MPAFVRHRRRNAQLSLDRLVPQRPRPELDGVLVIFVLQLQSGQALVLLFDAAEHLVWVQTYPYALPEHLFADFCVPLCVPPEEVITGATACDKSRHRSLVIDCSNSGTRAEALSDRTG